MQISRLKIISNFSNQQFITDYKRFVLFFLFLFSSITTSYSQVIRGIIKDTLGQEVPYVYIKVLNTNNGSVSDYSGKFLLRLSSFGEYTLSFSATGYNPLFLNINVKDDSTWIEAKMIPSDLSIGDIVVTANKTEDNILQVPVSMSVLSDEKIQDTKTWELENLVGLVPNFQYADVGVGYQQQMALRGVSVFSENPTVATYVDGVNSLDISSNGFQLTDLERIEILRGPQGTLYGRNAMAGVINIITKMPTNQKSGYSEVSSGNQGLQRYLVSYKTPLKKDKLFIGVTTQFQRLHGFYKSDTTAPFTFLGTTFYGPAPVGIRIGDENSIYGNFSLRWFPKVNTEISFNSKIQYDYSTGASSYYQAAVDDSFALNNPYKFTVNRLGSNRRLVSNNSLAFKQYYKKMTLTSVTAFQYVLQSYNNIDFDYWSFDVAYAASYYNKVGDYYPQKVFSQEFRLNSAPTNKKIKWTIGSYFFYQTYNVRTATIYVPPLGQLFGYSGTDVSQSDRRNIGIAGFGQLSYSMKEKLEFTLGLRYDYEDKSALIAMFNINEQDVKTYTRPETRKQKSFYAFSPKAVVSYFINKNNHTYVSYARGYRAGGINMFTNVSGYETFEPEYSNNYEVGYKMSNKKNKLYLSTCLFLMDWQNLQLDYRPSNANSWVTDNLGGVRSIGAEVELSFLPLKGLRVETSIGYNKATYKEFEYIGIQIGGNQTILAPTLTSIVAPQYTFPIGKNNRIKLVIRSEWRYIGNQYFDLANTIRQSPYHLFNIRSGIKFKEMEFFIWVQNISNTQYLTYAAPAYFRYSILSRPRTFGITLIYKF
jgi:iron complex outermembrane receptor protein